MSQSHKAVIDSVCMVFISVLLSSDVQIEVIYLAFFFLKASVKASCNIQSKSEMTENVFFENFNQYLHSPY